MSANQIDLSGTNEEGGGAPGYEHEKVPSGNIPGLGGNPQGKPEHHQKTITFGAPKKQGPPPEVIKLNLKVGEIGRKIRILEDRYSNVRRKTQVTDRNMLNIQKNINREIKTMDEQVLDLQKEISELDEKLRQILREIGNFAKSEDIKVLKRYLDFWEPVGFVTKSDVEQVVRRLLEEKGI
jgi:predicted RNase H-like nuclease (RuvC/YqgF family)